MKVEDLSKKDGRLGKTLKSDVLCAPSDAVFQVPAQLG
jgi:hypothetical protein